MCIPIVNTKPGVHWEDFFIPPTPSHSAILLLLVFPLTPLPERSSFHQEAGLSYRLTTPASRPRQHLVSIPSPEHSLQSL
jgi:hypothetical protein